LVTIDANGRPKIIPITVPNDPQSANGITAKDNSDQSYINNAQSAFQQILVMHDGERACKFYGQQANTSDRGYRFLVETKK